MEDTMAKLKHNPIPWDFLAKYKGELFIEEWPTIPEMFNITVKRYGERNCFLCFQPEKVVYTYNEVQKLVNQLADFMVMNGLKHGDRVGLTGKNSPEWGITYLAALFAGAIIVPVDHSLSVQEIDNLFDFAEVKMIFSDVDKLEKLENKRGVSSFCLEKDDRFTYVMDCMGTESQPRELPKSEEMAAILFTSGTTGTPKGVMLSHRNLVADCYMAQSNLSIYETDVFYALLPIHHSYTMLAVFIEAISVGAEIVFGKSMAVSRLMKELKDGGITMLLGVPMLFNKLAAGILKGIKEKGPIVFAIMKILMG